jgi:hypothetical protein
MPAGSTFLIRRAEARPAVGYASTNPSNLATLAAIRRTSLR